MADVKARLRVDMDGNVLSQARRYADEINRFSVSVTRNLRRVRVEAALSGADFHPFGAHVGALRTDIGALTGAIHAMTRALGQNTSHLGQNSSRLEQNSTDLGQNSSHLDRNADQLNRNSRALGRYRREADQAGDASRRMQRAGRRFGGLATGLGGAVAAGAFLQKDIELEKAMLQLKSNLLSGSKDAEDLNRQLQMVRDTAREISEMTIFSDAQMVTMTNSLLKAGVDSRFVAGKDGAAAGTAALAQLSQIDPEEAAKMVASIGHTFAFDTKKQYADLADYLSKADDASAMNAGQIMYNVKQGAETANALHINPKKLIAMNAYVDVLGEEAGTSVNRFLEGLAGVTKPKQKALQKSGMDFWHSDEHGHNVLKAANEVMNIVRKHFGGMKDEREMIREAHKEFGEEGARFALAISHNIQSFDMFEAKIEHSTGAQEKLAIQSSGLGVAFERLEHSVIAVAADAFEPLGECIKGVVNYLNDTVNGAKKPLDALAPGSMKSPGVGNPVKEMLLDVRHSVNSGGDAVGDSISGLVHGLASTLGLAPERPMFANGELPKVEITLRNQSDQPLKLGAATTKGGAVTLSNERAGQHFR